MSKYIYIEADTNDGDYTGCLSAISDEEIELIKPVIEAISNFEDYPGSDGWIHGNNFPTGECYRPDLGEKSAEELYGYLEGFELFEQLAPFGEYGIHTVTDIKILELIEQLWVL